jgi:hypothetical protein
MYGVLSMSLLLYGSAALGKVLYVFLDQRFHILLAWLILYPIVTQNTEEWTPSNKIQKYPIELLVCTFSKL